jgi:hypothetical protein
MGVTAAEVNINLRSSGQLDALQRTQRELDACRDKTEGWLSALRNGAAFAVATRAIDLVADAMRKVATVGIQFNSQLEQAKLGIAALQMQANPGAFRNIEEAIEVAAGAVDLLAQKAKASPASFSQLVEGFQAISGAATAAQIPLQKQVDLVVLLSQAVAGVGLRSDQFVQESRALLTGNINADAALAKMLVISAADINQARQAGTLFEFLTTKLAAFQAAGEKGATTFATLSANLGDAMEQASAVATAPLFEQIKVGLAQLNEFDWAGVGRKAATFVTATIEAWKQGQLTELIALTIGAGFQNGWKLAKQVLFSEAVQDMTGNFLRFIARMSVEITTHITEIVVDIATAIGQPFVALFGWLMESIYTLMENAFVRLRRSVAEIYNWGAEKLGSKSRMDIPGGGDANLPTYGEYFEAAGKSRDHFLETVRRYMNNARSSAAFLWSGGAVPGETMEEQLNALIEKLLQTQQQAEKTAVSLANTPPPAAVVAIENWREAERKAEEEIRRLQEQRAAIEADFTRTAAEKWAERSKLLGQEKDQIVQLIATLDERAKKEGDLHVAEQIRSRADSARGRLTGLNGQIVGLGADPNSTVDQVASKWTALMDRMGTDAQNLANVLVAPFEGLYTGLSSSIEGLINLTMTWGEALLNIGRSVVSSLVKAFADMVAQWIMSHVIMKGVSVAWHAFLDVIGWQRVATSNAQEAAKAPALMSNAWLANIGSWGTAALVGAAVVTAILAGIGAFADGGLVEGPGGPRDDRVLARVSPGEFIVPASAVQAIGLGNMKTIQGGQLPVAAAQTSTSVNVAPSPVRIIVVNSMAEAREMIKREGADLIVDGLNGQRMAMGMEA